jgi:hypothetical protein
LEESGDWGRSGRGRKGVEDLDESERTMMKKAISTSY